MIKLGIVGTGGMANAHAMAFKNINEVRQGKYFEIDVNEDDPKKAEDLVESMCKKLLANLVIENYKIIETQ